MFADVAELRKLLREDHVVLAFRDSIAVDENIFGKGSVFPFGLSEIKAKLQHRSEVVHILLSSALDAQGCRPSTQEFVGRSHHCRDRRRIGRGAR